MVEELNIRITVDDKKEKSKGGSNSDVVPATVAGAALGSSATSGGRNKPFLIGSSGKPSFYIDPSGRLRSPASTTHTPIGTPLHGASKTSAATKAAKSGNLANTFRKGAGDFKSFAQNPTSPLIGALSVVLTNPAVLAALASYGVLSVALNQYFADGAAGDRRLKLLVENQTVNSIDREELRLIRRGKQTIRVSTAAGLRGRQGSINSNLSQINQGNYIEVDLNEADVKNIT